MEDGIADEWQENQVISEKWSKFREME